MMVRWKTEARMTKVWWFGLIALLAVVTVVALRMYNKPHRTAGEVDFSISASQLIDDFSSDEAAATDKYVGKVLEVRGEVRELFHHRNRLVVVLGDSSRPAGVSFSFQEDRIDRARLEKGSPVVIKGICNGMLFDVVMDKAVLIDPPSVGS